MEYGPWQAVCGVFRRRQRDGTWGVLLTGLQTRAGTAGLITWEANVESTICRAHQHAAGAHRDGQAQKKPPGNTRTEPDDHGLSLPRGGFTTKKSTWPASKDNDRWPYGGTAGQRGDSPQFAAVLDAIRVPVPGRAVPVPARCECGATRRTRPAPAGSTCESGESAARSPSLPTRPPTATDEDRPAGGLQPCRRIRMALTGLSHRFLMPC